jgi:Concanavalin A-like lectin/glucanases superfamily
VRLFRVFGFLVLLVSLALPAWGKTVYVGTSGNDLNGCDSTTPTTRRQTINGGIACLNGGDTLIVGSGVYAEIMNSGNIPDGSSGTPTLVKSEAFRGAILRPNGGGAMIEFQNKANITIDGFVLDGTNAGVGSGGVSFHGQSGSLNNLLVMNVEIRNITADDQGTTSGGYTTTAGMGADGTNVNNVVMRNMLVHDIGMNCQGGNCCNECYGYGIYLSGNNYTLENSEFYNCTGWIVHGYTSGEGSTSNNTLRNNYFHNGGGPVLLCQANNKLYNNIIAHLGQMGVGVGTGIQFAGSCSGQPSHHNLVYNNTVWDVTGPCIDMGYGNTNTVQNNICYQTQDDSPNGGSGGGDTVTNNLTGANPLFVNGALTAAAHFQLQSGSPARNAGVSTASLFTTDFGGNARIQEGTQDMGAWEFGGGGPPPPSQGPIGWWKFNEGASTTAADSSGNGYTIDLAGTPVPTWVPGKVGSNALACPGTGGTARTTATFNPAQYSWAMWIQGNAAPDITSEQTPFIGGNWGFLWSLPAVGGDQSAFHQLSDTTYVDVRIPTQLVGQVWYHVGATWDGSTLRVYLNGQLAASGIAGSLNPTTDPLRLCGDPGDNSFAGRIDDVYIWDRTVTAAEMAAQFAAVKSKRARHHASMR